MGERYRIRCAKLEEVPATSAASRPRCHCNSGCWGARARGREADKGVVRQDWGKNQCKRRGYDCKVFLPVARGDFAAMFGSLGCWENKAYRSQSRELGGGRDVMMAGRYKARLPRYATGVRTELFCCFPCSKVHSQQRQPRGNGLLIRPKHPLPIQ